ncbi:MAG: sodium:solute symporter [Bryobacteraceae bacterium]|nr:sodium:solute symporter [Bryobacteraceae bacterium]
MRPLDWAVLAGSLVAVVWYGLRRGRGTDTVGKYLLAGKTMPWYAMALSIMATQASAITFISTTGQAYVDGMRFVQFYFGLPLAMILLSVTAVPIFHRAGVYTAYEYLEHRFDAKTRFLVSLIFLIQRGLAVGVALYAPAVVLTVILGWPDRITTLVMGSLVVLYTTLGGIKAVTWTDFQQMLIMFAGIVAALVTAIALLPDHVSFLEALTLAGAAGRLNAVTTNFDWNDRYNLWSGLIGGMFLALSYFGCDQSQVQRYLTGKSIAQSRLSLLFNAVAKVPMQFFILFTGAIVFVFYIFERPPLLFQPVTLEKLQRQEGFGALQARYESAFAARREAAERLLEARANGDGALQAERVREYRQAEQAFEAVRRQTAEFAESRGVSGANDTNYIFLTFVTRYMPAGVVGLIMAAIFAAAMSSISAEINSLATVTVVDIYRRHFRPEADDRHYLRAAKAATVFWGAYAVLTAEFGSSLGALIEAVNMVGSFFYGGMLGVFILAFYFPRVTANAAFAAVLAGEAAIFLTWRLTGVSFLWYNVIGCLVVILTGVLLSRLRPTRNLRNA